MLSKKQRVNQKNFPTFFDKNNSFYSKNITLKFTHNKQNLEKTKFCFIISKKVSTKANKRNLIRRRLKFVILKNNSKIKNGFICVFYIKKTIVNPSYSEIEKEVLFLLKKANIIV